MKLLRSLHLIIRSKFIPYLPFEAKYSKSCIFSQYFIELYSFNLFILNGILSCFDDVFPQLYNTTRNSLLYYKLIHFTFILSGKSVSSFSKKMGETNAGKILPFITLELNDNHFFKFIKSGKWCT